jgi:hypothetical protein
LIKQKYERFRQLQEKIQNISPIKQRILKYVDFKGISKRTFYAQSSISRGTLESNTGITEDTLAKCISTFPEINICWLITGKGEMVGKPQNEPSIYSTSPPGADLLAEKDKRIEDLYKIIETQAKLIKNLESSEKKKSSSKDEQKRKVG